MSERAKEARKAMRAKIARITKPEGDNSKNQIDASDFVGYPDLETTAKTGARPISRRQFKRGGKIVKAEGHKAKHHMGRKARKSGGKALTADSLINRNVREANENRDGVKHVGAFKKGGAVKRKHKMDGGDLEGSGTTWPGGGNPQSGLVFPASAAQKAEAAKEAAARAADDAKERAREDEMFRSYRSTGKKHGGSAHHKSHRKHKMDGGSFVPTSRMAFSGGESRMSKAAGLKKGGRARKAIGGAEMNPDEMEAANRVMRVSNAKGRLTPPDAIDEQIFDKSAREKYMNKKYNEYQDSKPLDLTKEMMVKNPRKGLKGLFRKRGGSAHSDIAEDKKLIKKAFRQHENAEHGGKHAELHLKKGGYAKKKHGGSMSVSDGEYEGTRPTGGRLARRRGGAAKGKMNVNIIIAQKPTDGSHMMPPGAGPAPARPVPVPPAPPPGGAPMGAGAPMPMPMPMPPAGGGAPMPPPPMGRKHGGKVGHRSYKFVKDMDAGAGGGEGRREKVKIYGLKPSQTTKNY